MKLHIYRGGFLIGTVGSRLEWKYYRTKMSIVLKYFINLKKKVFYFIVTKNNCNLFKFCKFMYSPIYISFIVIILKSNLQVICALYKK